MKYDAVGRPQFERGDRVWCWYDSFGPPVKGTILHRCSPRPHYEERYGVFLDIACPREGERLVTRAAWLIYSVFDPEIIQEYPLDALAEVLHASGA